MVQRLRRLIGRVDSRILIALSATLLIAGSLFTLAQLIQSTAAYTPTLSTWNDLAKEYLAARNRDYPLVVPTGFEDEFGSVEELQAQPDWYWTFDGGTFYFDSKSQIGKQIKQETTLVIYEDIVNRELLILQALTDGTYGEVVVYKAPSWPETADYSAELAKRRIVWTLNLRPKNLAAKELAQTEEIQLLSTDSEISVMRLMMFEDDDYTNHLWMSVRGPGQGYGEGVEYSVHIPANFTNKLEIFACTNLMEQNWSLAVTNLSTLGTDVVTWSDSEFTNLENGFYYACNGEQDSDSDYATDAREKLLYHTDMNVADTDGDGALDGEEIQAGTNPLNNPGDSDQDGLSDDLEIVLGTNPYFHDTDGDGFNDGFEIENGFDPLLWGDVISVPGDWILPELNVYEGEIPGSGNQYVYEPGPDDTDGDGYKNQEELIAGTDPANSNSYLSITNMRVSGATRTLCWPTVTNREYRLEMTLGNRGMITGPWTMVVQWIKGVSSGLNYACQVSETNRAVFFRLRVRGIDLDGSGLPDEWDVASGTIIKGDIDGDGIVSATDLVELDYLLAEYTQGMSPLVLARSDLNGDGIVDDIDRQALQDLLAGRPLLFIINPVAK